MCKVMMIAGIKKQHQDKVKKLTQEFIKEVSRTDNDGFGYAAITRDAKIYGEKWLRKEDVFQLHSQPKPSNSSLIVKNLLGEAAKITDDTPSEKVYDSFGIARTKDVLNNTVSVIVHARNSTVGLKTIENAHPFFQAETEQDPDTALIHNGGIRNHFNLTKKTSECDSEVILHEYLKNSMSYSPWSVTELAKTLVGEYTCGVLTSTRNNEGQDQPVLDIFKSNKDLYAGFVKELETVVFCTTKYALETAVKAAGMTVTGIAEVRDGYLIRLNAITGERLDDLIPFDLSRQYTNYLHTDTTGSHNVPVRVIDGRSESHNRHNVIVGPRREDSIELAKKNFEKNHQDLFTTPYYDLSTGLSDEEKAFYEELEAGKGGVVDLKALRLVRKIMKLA